MTPRHIPLRAILVAMVLGFLASACETKSDPGEQPAPKPGDGASAKTEGGTATKPAELTPATTTTRAAPVEKPASVPAPMKADIEGLLGYVTVPNVDAALSAAAGFAALFDPSGSVNTEMMKAQIGAAVGDPKLEKLDLGKPALAGLTAPSQPGAPPSYVFLLAAPEDPAYGEMLSAMGVASKFSGGILYAGESPAAVEGAAKLKPLYDTIAAAKLTSNARLHVNVEGTMTIFGPLIQAGVDQMLAELANAPGLGAGAGDDPNANVNLGSMMGILKAEVLGGLALLEQIGSAQIDLTVGSKGIVFEKLLGAKPSSELAAFFAASAARPAATSTVLPPTAGNLAGTFSVDPASAVKLLEKLGAAIGVDPETKAFAGPLIDAYIDMGKFMRGDGAFSVNFDKEGMALNYALGIKNESAFLASMEKWIKLLSPGEALHGLYKGLGMELGAELTKDVRKSDGLSVHKWEMKTKVTDEQLAAMTQMGGMQALLNQSAEFAIVDGQVFFCSDSANLDGMIVSAKKGALTPLSLKSKDQFGAGRHAYADYDVLGLMSMMLGGMIPGFDALPKPENPAPMIAAMTFGGDSMLVQAELPSELFVQIMSIGMLVTSQAQTQTQEAKIQNDMRMIVQAAEIYYAMKGEWPKDQSSLVKEKVIDGPALDPWGREYKLEIRGESPVALTFGADGEIGGDGENADIVFPPAEE